MIMTAAVSAQAAVTFLGLHASDDQQVAHRDKKPEAEYGDPAIAFDRKRVGVGSRRR